MRETAVPFESRLSPATIAAVAMWLASVAAVPAVLKLSVLGRLARAGGEPLPVLLFTTALLTTVVAHYAPRARSMHRAIVICVLVAPLLGAINVGLSAAILHAMGGQLVEGVAFFFIGSLFGLLMGAPVGLAFGIGFLVPTVCTVRDREVASHAVVERSLRTVGLWLLAWGFIVLACLRFDAWTLSLPAALCFGVGGLGAAVGIALTLRRERWLERVRDGRISGWAIEPRDDRHDEEDLRPFVHQSETDCEDVLVRRIDMATPYRDRANAVPIALL